MSKSAIYPGSFDPVTNGHLDLIKRASRIFDHVIIGVATTTQKQTLFNAQERVELIEQTAGKIKGVTIETFDGLVIEFAAKKNVNVLIRGLRMFSDFEYEFQMALTNRRLAETIETVFLMPSEGYSYLSSTLIKEAASLGADITSFVPGFVAEKLHERLSGARR